MKSKILSTAIVTTGLIGAAVAFQNQPAVIDLLTNVFTITQSLLISNLMPSIMVTAGIFGSSVFSRKNFLGALAAIATTGYLAVKAFNLSKKLSGAEHGDIEDTWKYERTNILNELVIDREPMLQALPAKHASAVFAALPLIAYFAAEVLKNLSYKLIPTKPVEQLRAPKPAIASSIMAATNGADIRTPDQPVRHLTYFGGQDGAGKKQPCRGSSKARSSGHQRRSDVDAVDDAAPKDTETNHLRNVVTARRRSSSRTR